MSDILSKEDIQKILLKRFENDKFTTLSSLPNPILFKDMQKSAKRVAKALKNKEKITIIGDYDVDGVVSSFILSDFLEKLSQNIEVIIPNRFSDGYGVSKSIVERLEPCLVITVDNGISAVEAAEVCLERGVDLIITDHHTVPKNIPKAYAIINPKQEECSFPYKEICGAQVAWYFVAAIKQEMRLDFNLLEYIDLLSIAIVADMMELKGLNRMFVKKGLKAINNTKRASILSIKEKFEKESFSSEDISFLLAPLLNSAGRMDSAMKAFNFLRAKTMSEATVLLQDMIKLNEDRKDIEKELFEISETEVDKNQNIIVVWGSGWHEGVIGIVAARLTRRFKKPAIVFSVTDDKAKGSARSVGEVNILSLIEEEKDNILGYGGHKGAAGLSIETKNLPIFKASIEKRVNNLKKELFISNKEILGEIDAKEIDFELLDILESFEPYGQKNPKPYFLIKNAKVKKTRILGKAKNHQKIIIEHNNSILESIYFNYQDKVNVGFKIDILFSISKNYYRGYVTPQLLIKEIII